MASHSEVDNTGMRPYIGQRTMALPITFDYSGGRAAREKSNKVTSLVMGIVGFILAVGVLFTKIQFLLRILISVGIVIVVSTVIRFFFLKEKNIRSEKIQDMDRDYKVEVSRYWGIYDIGDLFPYICHFRNGKNGMFIQLNKDVILGKFAEAEFDHYEAIGDAYNIAGSSNIQMCHLDYMDVVGSDERLEDSFASLDRVSNPDLKDLLTDIFTYQQEMMYKRITSFDVYLFLWSSRDDLAWEQIQRILACFLEANYRSYHVLNKKDVGDLTKVIMFLEDNFSTEEAMLNAFVTEKQRGITPIRIDRADGSYEVLGKTAEEKRQEARELEAKREAKKNGKGKSAEGRGNKPNEKKPSGGSGRKTAVEKKSAEPKNGKPEPVQRKKAEVTSVKKGTENKVVVDESEEFDIF